MSARFSIDLVHPGRVAQTWQQPFIGPQGRRHLALFVLVGVGVLLLVRLWLSTGLMASIIQCAVVGTVMALAYAAILRLLRVTELDNLLIPILRRLRTGRR